MSAACPPPEIARRDAGAPATLVSPQPAGASIPATAALIRNGPATVPAIADTAACPASSVVSAADDSDAVAPEAGAENATSAPGTPLPYASTTLATSGRP